MRSKITERILAKTPEDVKIFARLYGDLIVRVNMILKEKGYSQKCLAEKLGKSPSEINKWLSGEHNFTLRSIARLEAELGETLLEVPKPHVHSDFHSAYGKTTFKVFVNKPQDEDIPENRDPWKKYEFSNEQKYNLANVRKTAISFG